MAKEVFVKLGRLPEGLEFPVDLRDRISYDSQRERLAFRGFMSKSEFDRLRGLSQDLEFERAVEQLFQKSANAAGNGRISLLTWGICVLVIVALIAAAVVEWLIHW